MKIEEVIKIIKIIDETPDVKTFRLKSENNIDFIPGQYCMVSFPDDEDNKRPFTFSSSPTEKGYIDLTVKKMGVFTTKLYSLGIGDKLKIIGPNGESLNFDGSVKEDIVFIAGGSGITPFISALRYAAIKNLPNSITLLFSSKTEKDIIYKDEMVEMDRKDNIKVINTLSDKSPDGWYGEKGRIDKNMIEKHVDNPKEKIWYVCAPPPMVKAMREILNSMGIPEENLRIEDWEIPGKHDKE